MATGGQQPEEATASSARPKNQGYLYLFLSLHLPAVAMGLGQGITTPVLPIFARDEFNVGVALAAYLFVAQMLGGMTASVPVGYAIDRWGRRRILLAGPLITAAALFLTATAQSFAMLLVFRFIAGWGQQMWMLSRLTVIADRGGGARGRQITSMFGIQQVGILAGPLAGGILASTVNLQAAFILQGVVSILAVVPSFFVYRESAPKPSAANGGPAASGPIDDFSWRSLLSRPILVLFTAQLFGMTARGGAIGGGTLFVCRLPSAASAMIQCAPFFSPASWSNTESGTPVHSLHPMRPCVPVTVVARGFGRLPMHSRKPIRDTNGSRRNSSIVNTSGRSTIPSIIRVCSSGLMSGMP